MIYSSVVVGIDPSVPWLSVTLPNAKAYVVYLPETNVGKDRLLSSVSPLARRSLSVSRS